MNDFHSKWKTFLKEGLDGTGTDWNAHEKMKEQIVDMLQRGHASVDDILAGLQDYHGWTEQDMGAAQGALEDLVGDGILSVDGIGMYSLGGGSERQPMREEYDDSLSLEALERLINNSADRQAVAAAEQAANAIDAGDYNAAQKHIASIMQSSDRTAVDYAEQALEMLGDESVYENKKKSDNKDDDGFVYATDKKRAESDKNASDARNAYKPKNKGEDDEEKKTNESEEMNMKTDVSKLVNFLFHKSEQVSAQMEKIKGDKTESAQLIAHMLNELGMSPQEFSQILPKVKANMSELRVANIVREELSRLLK